MLKLASGTYGVLRKNGEFSFVGFVKKAKSDEVQKVDIYLDKELIDTINADEYNQEIDDLYGVDNLAFNYNLPLKYIDGKSHNLSFKIHGTDEQLRGSPLSVMEKSHKNFNEARFMRSLDEPLSEELKDMYKPNSIGFLATKENMEDEEFVDFIIFIAKHSKGRKINCFYFSKDKKTAIPFQNLTNISFLPINDISQMITNMEIYIHNMDTKKNNIRDIIMFETNEIFCVSFSKKTASLTLKEHSELSMKPGFPYYDNPSYFGFSDDDVKNSQGNMHALVHSKLTRNNSSLDLNQTLKEAHLLYLNNALIIKKHKEYIKILNRKFKKYKDEA